MFLVNSTLGPLQMNSILKNLILYHSTSQPLLKIIFTRQYSG
jgi:hypothetical protein